MRLELGEGFGDGLELGLQLCLGQQILGAEGLGRPVHQFAAHGVGGLRRLLPEDLHAGLALFLEQVGARLGTYGARPLGHRP